MSSAGEPVRRLGRPPATDSAETRQRIVDVARAEFAACGYGATTNRTLAKRAGITPGALYHYFESKLDLYLAVNDDMRERVYERFNDAVDGADGFLGKFDAVLDAAHAMNREDPTLAAFLGATRADMRRNPEIAEVLAEHAERRQRWFHRLVDSGVDDGEIAPENRPLAYEFIMTILTGLTDGMSADLDRHRRAIDAMKHVVRGDLFTRST